MRSKKITPTRALMEILVHPDDLNEVWQVVEKIRKRRAGTEEYMKLWLLKARKDLPNGDNPWEPSDKYEEKSFGSVVRAETEEQARQIAHERAGDENYGQLQPWLNSKYSECAELLQDGAAEMVLEDFHAA